jgi:hypothetical protein
MKNRLLPFGFFTTFLGLSFLLFSNLILAASPDTPEKTGPDRMQQIRANQVTGKIDPADVMKARVQLEKLQAKSSASLGLNWNFLGPDNFSGRSRSVIFDSRDTSGSTLYTGGVMGGVWKSTNLGLTWVEQNTNSSEILRVSAITQTPSGVIYVGTGESFCGTAQYMGTGLYRSEDGLNFILVPTAKPVANDPESDWASVIKLTCSSTGRLFAATNKGVKYSDDGATWVNIKTGAPTDIEVGSNGTVIFSVDDSVYIARNGDFSQIVDLSQGTATTLPKNNVGWVELAIAPSDPNVMYASIAKTDGKLLNVYMSSDNGVSWTVIFPGNGTQDPFTGGVGCSTNTLAVYINDPFKVLLGGANLWYGQQILPTGFYNWMQESFGDVTDLDPAFVPLNHHCYVFNPHNVEQFVIASDNGISVSEGGVFTFSTSNKNLVTAQMNSIGISREPLKVIAGGSNIGTQMIGGFVANYPTDGKQIWLETGAANDGGSGFQCAWSTMFPTAVIYSKMGNKPPYRRSDNLGETFSPQFLGGIAPDYSTGITSTLTQYLPINLAENFNFTATHDSVKYYAIDSTANAGSTVVCHSANGAFPFEYVLPVTVVKGDSLMVPDYVQARFFIYGTKSSTGIFMTKQAIQFSYDPEWFQLLNCGSEVVTCIAVSQDFNYLWAGTTAGKIYRIGNLINAYDSTTASYDSAGFAGVTTVITDPQFTGRYITSISINPTSNDQVLVTLGNYGNDKYVYIAENALDATPTFVSAQGNLPASPVYTGLFELHGGNKAIIGTDLGVFTTSDITAGSPAWATDYTGMGTAPVTQLVQQTNNFYIIANYGDLYAATLGQGLYYDSTYFTPMGIDPGTPGNRIAASLNVSPNPVRSSAKITYVLSTSSNVAIVVYDMNGKVVYTAFPGSQKEGEHTYTINLNGLGTGAYIVKVNDAAKRIIKIQ